MKTVFPTSELVHIWAKQSQNNGRNATSNVFFDGSRIYSYGRHFCMGDIIKPGIVLLTDRTYSNTTRKHQSAVRHAVNHMEQIHVPYPESFTSSLQVWEERIKDQLSIIGHPRKRQSTKDSARVELTRIASTIERYCNVTGNKLPKDFKKTLKMATDEQACKKLAEKLGKEEAEREQAARERMKERNREETERKQQAFEQWKQGVSSYYHDFRGFPVALRAKDGNVETSHGARVAYESAKLLYTMIVNGKDIKGHNIDGYTVISMNGVLTIGCHKIEREEIERFAKTQNW